MDSDLGFAFVDLAGFTALTEAHGDEVGATQVARFGEITRDSLAGGTVLVKSLGDAVMLAGPPAGVQATALGVMRACVSVRAGVPIAPRRGARGARSPAGRRLSRHGGEYGGADRRARRWRAAPVQRVDAPVRPVSGRGHGPTRCGVAAQSPDPVELHMIELDAGGALIDPVCRMRVALESAAGHLKHAGADWWICSLQCAAAFAQNPAAYAG